MNKSIFEIIARQTPKTCAKDQSGVSVLRQRPCTNTLPNSNWLKSKLHLIAREQVLYWAGDILGRGYIGAGLYWGGAILVPAPT